MNYLKFKVNREVSRFLCRSVYYHVEPKHIQDDSEISLEKNVEYP
jgi:hypothetical protein